MANSLRLAFLVLFQSLLALSLAHRYPTKCSFDKLVALEPSKRVESEGGFTEYWDSKNDQFQCVGVSALRYSIKPKGLLLPHYINAPRLQYVLQGTGILETVVPGCPETFREQTRHGDQHQKIHATREGDVIVVPTGSAQWIYNTGETDMVIFSVIDSANEDNQLDLKVRKFFLGGKPQEEKGEEGNMFSGLELKTVAESLGIDMGIAGKVQGVDDPRGSIIIVEDELETLSPAVEESGNGNGLDETLCTLRLVHQLAESTDADKYNPRAGFLTALNTPNLPVLQYVQLGVDRGVLYKNAVMAPHYNLNCHAVIYGTEGRGWIEVVGENGRKVYEGEVREGQILIVPQQFVVAKKAAEGSDEGFGWIAVKTSDNPMISPLAGKLSLIRAMPLPVLMNSFRLTAEEAINLKKRGELTLFSPDPAHTQI
ncbi:hypothetical protein HN51_014376 [Arachis hypogaea]|uniref:11S globulin subunit beta n=1 Tax=Arachis hypogaea TaxID=3818 RepID=UPI000DECADF8|nr:11S globulin subunit beta [Arachis hypogaea]QHO45446.1 11S globulin subunit beta [Arachis hypogaea]